MNNSGALLEINQSILKAIKETIKQEKPIHQPIVEAAAKIIDAKRCILFTINSKDGDIYCKITAGVGDGHGIGEEGLIENHPDVEAVMEKGEIILIADPLENRLTNHFQPQVISKNISQILYIPIITEANKMEGVLVIDKMNGEIFSEGEMEICEIIGGSISMVLDLGEFFIFELRDRLNKLISISGPIIRAGNLAKKFVAEIAEVEKAVKKMEKEFPTGGLIKKI